MAIVYVYRTCMSDGLSVLGFAPAIKIIGGTISKTNPAELKIRVTMP
jgi:hypothetical protein